MKDKINIVLKISLFLIFLAIGVFLFIIKQYFYGLVSFSLLIIIYKIDDLREFIINQYGVKGKFIPTKEKIKENILENQLPQTKSNFLNFLNIKSKILNFFKNKLRGEITSNTYIIVRWPKKDFIYKPDATIKTKNAYYLYEIKYIVNSFLFNTIAEDIVKKLKITYKYLKKSFKDKNLCFKLVFASKLDLDIRSIKTPSYIDVIYWPI